MAVKKYKGARGEGYEARVRLKDNREISKRFPIGRAYDDGPKKAAEAWEREQRHALDTGVFRDRRKGNATLGSYVPALIERRYEAGEIRASTADLQAILWNKHTAPMLGAVTLNALTTPMVREWHAKVRADVSAITAAKAYRLLRMALGIAVEDGLISVNPCTIKRAGQEKSPERPIATRDQVYELADAVPAHRRALVLMGAWGGLRVSECAGLRRRDVDLMHATVTVAQQLKWSKREGGYYEDAPKTEAGRRTVPMPTPLVAEMIKHMAQYTGPEADAYVFAGERGAPLVKSHWGVDFRAACDKVRELDRPAAAGQPPVRFTFHDLRHTGNTLAASTGQSLADLMARMGHASPQAALRYLHKTNEGQHAIADALGKLMEQGADEGQKATVHKLAPRKVG